MDLRNMGRLQRPSPACRCGPGASSFRAAALHRFRFWRRSCFQYSPTHVKLHERRVARPTCGRLDSPFRCIPRTMTIGCRPPQAGWARWFNTPRTMLCFTAQAFGLSRRRPSDTRTTGSVTVRKDRYRRARENHHAVRLVRPVVERSRRAYEPAKSFEARATITALSTVTLS